MPLVCVSEALKGSPMNDLSRNRVPHSATSNYSGEDRVEVVAEACLDPSSIEGWAASRQ